MGWTVLTVIALYTAVFKVRQAHQTNSVNTFLKNKEDVKRLF